MIERKSPSRRLSARAFVTIASACGLLLAGLAGCSGYSAETGFSNQCRTQLQFYAPPGATVTVKGCTNRSHDVADYTPYNNRLELTPEEFSVFNLRPGRYEFKYTSADGLPGVSVYGELNIEYANSHVARIFQRRAFIPIALPSEHYRKVEVTGDVDFPYTAEAYRTAVDEYDLQRLRQGDVVEKVFFVADLEKAAKTRDKTIRDLKVLERKMEYADERFQLAYQSFRAEVRDPTANFFGSDREFIGWEKERQDLAIKYEALEKKLQRIQALLNGDHVIIRKGMMALATEEIIEPYRDVASAADDLGEVLLVMRIGGRHMQWGDPGRDVVTMK